MTVPIYIPTNSVRGFPFLHTLSSIHYFLLMFKQGTSQGTAWNIHLSTFIALTSLAISSTSLSHVPLVHRQLPAYIPAQTKILKSRTLYPIDTSPSLLRYGTDNWNSTCLSLSSFSHPTLLSASVSFWKVHHILLVACARNQGTRLNQNTYNSKPIVQHLFSGCSSLLGPP